MGDDGRRVTGDGGDEREEKEGKLKRKCEKRGRDREGGKMGEEIVYM